MNKMILTGILMGCFVVLTACSATKSKNEDAGKADTGSTAVSDSSAEAGKSQESASAYHKITAEEAKKMMDEGNVTVVDVRREDEYTEKHIKGAILVPNETIEEEAAEALPDQDAVILVHCRTGVRSKQASHKLIELGYKNIYDFGGIVDWKYETESGEPK